MYSIKKLGWVILAASILFIIKADPLVSFATNSGIAEDWGSGLTENTDGSYSEICENEKINFNTIKRVNPSLAAGETVVVRAGECGVKSVVYGIRSKEGVEISRNKVSEKIVSYPVDKIVEYGSPLRQMGTGGEKPFAYKDSFVCKATAYCYDSVANSGYGGITATGLSLAKGIIAVDPSIIPLGSRVYVESLDGSWVYGFGVAADTGGAIKGQKIDLCFRTLGECYSFGVRNCRIYILN